MTLSPVPVEGFGGLNLAGDQTSAGWGSCIDALNVEVFPGTVRSRGGYGLVGTAAAAIDSLAAVDTTGTQYLILGTTTPTLQVFSTGGVAQTVNRIGGGTGTTQSASAASHNFVSFGDTTHEYVYIANGTDQIRRFEPSTLTFTAPAALSAFTANLVAVTPWDNRLVTNGTTNKSRIWFSDNDPAATNPQETFGANNFIDLTPGDGEKILAIHAWRDLLFVFKRSKYFVFYGTSPDSSGNPIFNYRTVNTGIGLSATDITYAQRAVVATPDGLYFAGALGVYRTTGGPPELVSGPLTPLFTLDSSRRAPFYARGNISWNPNLAIRVQLVWSDRLYVICEDAFGSLALVYDPAVGWVPWSMPTNVIAGTAQAQGAGGPFLYFGSGTSLLAYFPAAVNTTDNGTAITSRYRAGFSDLGSPDMKRIHSWRVDGSGAPTLQVSTDFGALETGAALTLGTSPAIAEAVRRYAPRGRQFSWQLGASSGLWSVNNLVANVAGKRKAGEHVAA